MLSRRSRPVLKTVIGNRNCLRCLYRTFYSACFAPPLQRDKLAQYRDFKIIRPSLEHRNIKTIGSAAFHTDYSLAQKLAGAKRRTAISARKRRAAKAQKAGNTAQSRSGTARKSTKGEGEPKPSLDENIDEQDDECDVQRPVRNVESKRKRMPRFVSSRSGRPHAQATDRPLESTKPEAQSANHSRFRTLKEALTEHPQLRSTTRVESGILNSSDMHFEGTIFTSALS